MLDDLRYSIRGLMRSRGMSVLLLVSLALGTGVNVAVYGVVDTLLFRPPAGVSGAAQLVTIHTSQFSGASYGQSSYDDFVSLRRETAVELAAAVDDAGFENATMGAAGQRVRVAQVSHEYFPLLRMTPAHGRVLAPEDEGGPAKVAVISHSLWTALGADPAITDGSIMLGRDEYSVVGVLPKRFRGLSLGRVTDVWTPIQPVTRAGGRGDRRFSIVARVRVSDTVAATQQSLDALALRLAAAYPTTNRGSLSGADDPRRFTAVPYAYLDPGQRTNVSMIAAVVVAASALLLASAAINAGTLLLSRAMTRKRELSVKLALGATRGLLIRQVMLEGVLIAGIGAAMGLMLAWWTLHAIPALFSPDHAQMLDTELRFPVVLATVFLACGGGVLLGVVPALQGTGAPLVTALRGDVGGVSDQQGGRTFRNTLVAAQVALSTLLILATGILLGSLSSALEADLETATKRVAVITIKPPGAPYDAALAAAYQHKALNAVKSMPGMRDVGWISAPPLIRAGSKRFSIEAGSASLTDAVELDVNVASTGYFRALRLALIDGRYFTDGDAQRSAPVVIVNDLLARRYFGWRAVGHRLREADGRVVEIIGVVRSRRYRTLQETPQPMVYYSSSQEFLPRSNLIVRTEGEPADVLDSLTAALIALDGRVEITKARTLQQHLSDALAVDRLVTALVALCGLIAMLMSTIGVYGVMNDAVRRRTREIGLRVALGASRPRVVQLVLAAVASLSAAGIAAGVLAAFLSARVAASIVYGVPRIDTATLVLAPAAIAVLVSAAAVFPMRRALRINPTVALRTD